MKKKILTDIKIVCEPPNPGWRRFADLEEEAIYYESWVTEFQEFIRDHRSQDPVYLNVEREYKDLCEFCKSDWEVDENNCPICCDKAVEEYEKVNNNCSSVS